MNASKKEVKEFIQRLLDVNIDDNSILFQDFQIDGLDAESFIKEFSNEFDVDISNFEGSKFYTPEIDIANFPKTIFYSIFNRKKLKKITFNLDHLVNVAKNGRWFDP